MISQEIPLIGFTLFSQLSVGALILYNFLVFLPIFRNKGIHPAKFKTIPVLSFIFLGISIVFALFHLGKPLRALNSLDNFATSWLSREILMVLLYFICSALFILSIYMLKEWKRLMLLLLNLTSLAGFILIYSMARIYSSMPVPLWEPTFTFLNFLASTFSLGGILLLLVQIRHGSWSGQQSLAWIVALVLFLEIIFIPIFLTYLEQNSMESKLSLKVLLEDYGVIFYLRLACQVLSLVFMIKAVYNIRSYTDDNRRLFLPVIAAACFIFMNEIFGRILFYVAEVGVGSL